MANFQTCALDLDEKLKDSDGIYLFSKKKMKSYTDELHNILKKPMSDTARNTKIEKFFDKLGRHAEKQSIARQRTYQKVAELEERFKSAKEVIEKSKINKVKNKVIGEQNTEQQIIFGEFEGSKHVVDGGKHGVNQIAKGNEARLAKFMDSLLEEKTLRSVLRSGAEDTKIARAMYNIQNGLEHGADVSPMAIDVGQKIVGFKKEIRDMLGEVGIIVTDRNDHIIFRSHYTRKIYSNEAAWREFMEKNIDWVERSISETSDKKAYIDSFFRSLDDQDMIAESFSGRRTFKFLSPEADIEYHKLFGKGDSILDSIIGGSRKAARTAALAEKFGPEWKLGIERFKKMTDGKQNRLIDELTDYALGKHERILYAPFAKGLQAAKQLVSSSKLTFAFLTAMPDLVTASHIYAVTTGRNRFAATGTLLGEYAKNLGSPARRARFAKDIGFVLENTHAMTLLDARANGILGSGGIEAALRLTHKLNLLSPHSNSIRASLSHLIARDLRVGLANLQPQTKTFMRSFGFSDMDIRVLKETQGKLTVDSILRNEKFSKAEAGSAARKFERFINEANDMATAKQGAKEARQLHVMLDKNTVTGSVVSLFQQFMGTALKHSDSVAYMARAQADLAGGSSGAFAVMLTESMVLAYLGENVRRMAKGEELLSPNKLTKEEIADLLVRTGYMGLLGDAVLHSFGKYSEKASSTLIGPVPSEIYKGLSLINKGLDPDKELESAQVWKYILGNTPVAGTFYTRAALNGIMNAD